VPKKQRKDSGGARIKWNDQGLSGGNKRTGQHVKNQQGRKELGSITYKRNDPPRRTLQLGNPALDPYHGPSNTHK